MSTNVLMPQMGESVAEGTIVRWIKRVGDAVDKDEPLFEISTDKVDAEIPAPDAGTLLAIHVKEGETVPINFVVAVIGGATELRATTGATGVAGATGPQNELTPSSSLGDAAAEGGRHVSPVVPQVPDRDRSRAFSARADRLRTHSSPVVRRIAAAHGVDISKLTGTGVSGRVTRRDIEAYVHRQSDGARVVHPAPLVAKPSVSLPPAYVPGENVRIEKMSIMRRKIAEHMLASVQTSPHVYSAVEVDCLRIDELRRKHRAGYEARGVKLTYTAFIARATVEAIREFPFMNASVDGDNVVYKNDINLSIAVALDQGLIAPVVRKADTLSVLELSRAIQDIATRARAKQLKVDDVQGGTFTITNAGVFGGLWGLPIINQPQVAILAVGTVDKRAVVVDDQIVSRPMCYLTLGHDHRLIDGAEGGRFMQALKARIQDFDESQL